MIKIIRCEEHRFLQEIPSVVPLLLQGTRQYHFHFQALQYSKLSFGSNLQPLRLAYPQP